MEHPAAHTRMGSDSTLLAMTAGTTSRSRPRTPHGHERSSSRQSACRGTARPFLLDAVQQSVEIWPFLEILRSVDRPCIRLNGEAMRWSALLHLGVFVHHPRMLCKLCVTKRSRHNPRWIRGSLAPWQIPLHSRESRGSKTRPKRKRPYKQCL